MKLTRRRFLAGTTTAGAGMLAATNSLGQLIAALAETRVDFAAPGEFKVPYFGSFSELPVGAVKARGWLAGWLERQTQGLTGHPENMAFPYDTCMLAGTIPPPPVKHGEVWWPYEQSSYFFDGSVRLGLLVDDPAAKKVPAAMVSYLLSQSGPDRLGASTWGWPNAVAGRGLMAQYSGTGDPATMEVLRTYLEGSRIGGSRDGFVAEEALYLYGLSGEARLREIARECYDRFFLNDPRSFSHQDKIRGDAPIREHGVTAAEQLKLLPMMYSYTGDAQALELARLAYRKVADDSMMPDGGMVSSEALGTAAFQSMHETCDITDWSWSLGYMLMASGEGRWGDTIERATFNALPGAVTKDFRQLQYFSSANQVLCSSTACTRIAMTRMSYRAAHETECCSGNVNRAMPNYVTRMWMRAKDGLAAVLYGPAEVTTTIDGHAVRITETTDYPFRDTVTFKLKVAQPHTFTLHLRIPEWCEAASLRINGKASGLAAAAGTFVPVRRQFRDGDVISMRLPMKTAVETWFGGKAGVVRRGPLVYSLKMAERRVEIREDAEAIRRVLKGNEVQGFPAVEFYPESEWRYGMDSGVKADPSEVVVKESAMPANPFLVATVPVQLTVPLRPVHGWAADWKAVLDPPPADLKQAPKNPTELPSEAELGTAGEAERITLVPYGCTHLRVTTFPVVGKS